MMPFVSCICWIKRGVTKSNPDKVKLSPEELAEVLKSSICEEVTHPKKSIEDVDDSRSEFDEYNFENYDIEEENVGSFLALQNIVDVDSLAKVDEEDSDDEDDVIQESDNLIITGCLDKEFDALTVYVFNEKNNDFYPHHDIMVTTPPLCLEWLNYTNQKESANFIAVGGMSSVIEIWDVDMINEIQPICTLGSKTNKKKYAHRNSGHKDAVLDLSWNCHFPHILASSSVDKSVFLWDLDSKKPNTKLDNFDDKIETIEWHTHEGQTLLAASADGAVRIFDCRFENTYKEWRIHGEPLIAKWNIWNPYTFLVGTSLGSVYGMDCRHKNPVWVTEATSEEVTGLSMAAEFSGLMMTCHLNGIMRIFDIRNNPILVTSSTCPVQNIHAFALNPDSSYIGCIGGSSKNKNLAIISVKKYNEVISHWSSGED